MALRLSVVSDHRQVLGERSSIVLRAAGATIGRAPSNDWVLPDPQRYVSARHARIAWRNGQYFVEDLSTNGVYVNEDERPLGKDVARQLCSGDVLRVGEYQLVVAVEEDPRQPSAAVQATSASGPAVAVPTSIGELRAVDRRAQPDLGSALDLGRTFGTGSALQQRPATGQCIRSGRNGSLFGAGLRGDLSGTRR